MKIYIKNSLVIRFITLLVYLVYPYGLVRKQQFMKENNIDESCVVFMMFEGQEPIHGDANGDGTLNIRDCAKIAQFAAQGKTDSLPNTADYNKDGKKNVRDAAAISKDLANK